MLKISYAGCLVLSLAISSQFSVEMKTIDFEATQVKISWS